MSKTLWTLPVPTAAILGAGATLDDKGGREVALSFSYETESDAVCDVALVVVGVEAYRVTYHHAIEPSALEAYDRFIDRGATAWLDEVRANLRRSGDEHTSLFHAMILLDDGPCYEFICRGHRIESSERPGVKLNP